MPLPELRCKQEHMAKPTVQILSNSKSEVERKKEVGSGSKKKRKTQRLSKDITTMWIPVATFWSFFTLVFSEVGVPESFFWRYHFYKVQVSAIHRD